MLPSVQDETALGTEIAGYRLDEILGRGGMGVVYLATDIRLKRRVALKVIAPEHIAEEDFRRRFERESELAASVDHPNVIPIYHAGDAGGLSFLTMKYVDGTDLKGLIDASGALAFARAADLIAQAAEGLDAAHARGLVHRDVKPANLLVQKTGGREHVYVTDFGLTKQIDAETSLTATGMFVGTVNYIAPEQINGERIDARTDVYALGAVLHHALTGEVPFPRSSAMATVVAQLNDPPPAPSFRVGELPPGFDHVVVKAMAKKPQDRYQSAGELGRAALAAAKNGGPPPPPRPVAVATAGPTVDAPRRVALPRPQPAPPLGDSPGAKPDAARGKTQGFWVLWPILSFGVLAIAGFAYAGSKADRKDWIYFGGLYSTLTFGSAMVGGQLPEDSVGNAVMVAIFALAWIASIVHALIIRGAYVKRVEQRQ